MSGAISALANNVFNIDLISIVNFIDIVKSNCSISIGRL